MEKDLESVVDEEVVVANFWSVLKMASATWAHNLTQMRANHQMRSPSVSGEHCIGMDEGIARKTSLATDGFCPRRAVEHTQGNARLVTVTEVMPAGRRMAGRGAGRASLFRATSMEGARADEVMGQSRTGAKSSSSRKRAPTCLSEP